MNPLKLFFLLFFLLCAISTFAQSGCTDWQASNFDPTAVVNDGSCIYPLTVLPLTFKCNIDSAELKETSGITRQGNNLWTHVDDANKAIYRIDTLSDSIFQKVTINNSNNYDWEDITSDDNYIYVGEVGNNAGNRTNLRLYKILQSAITPSTVTVNAGTIRFSYSDQLDFTVNHNSNYYDCEAFISMNDSIHLFTKGWVNKWTKHYVMSADTGVRVAQLVDSFDVGGLITSAAIQGDSLVVLLGLNFSGGQNCFAWMFSRFQGSDFFGGNKRRLSIGPFYQFGQMEGICFKDTNKGYICNERNEFGSFYISSQLREFDLNPFLGPPPPSPDISTSVDTIIRNLEACSDSGSATFTIKNTSIIIGTELYFSIGGLPSWVSAAPISDSIAPGDSALITLSFTSGSLNGGAYVANLLISSNDIYHPHKNIQCLLNVDSNLCMDFAFASDTCTGDVNFTSSSINMPATYHWEFDDGDTSNAANPAHTYAVSGNYLVTLIGCNGAGCDTISHQVQSAIHGIEPAACYPTTQFYCCAAGITLFRLTGLFGDVINNYSSDATVGYEDFSCVDSITLDTNTPYALTCTTGVAFAEYLKVWLDMNNDGMIDSVAEQLYFDPATVPPAHTGTITVPSLPGNVYGVPLRLRVTSDFQQVPQPCLNPLHGQAEDYSIILNLSTVGINEIKQETRLLVYPNPFTHSTSIDYTLMRSSNVRLEVFNVLGERVGLLIDSKSQSPGKYKYQFGEKPAGIYFVKLSIDDKGIMEKVVKVD